MKQMHWIWIVIGVFVGVVALIGLVGALTPETHVASRTAVFKQKQQEIWNLLTDVKNYPTWRREITSVEVLPEKDGHMMWKESGKWGEVTMERTEAVEPRRLVGRIADTDQGYGGGWTWELAPAGDGTRVTITERGEVHNIFFRFMAHYIFGYNASMDGYLRQIGAKFGQLEIEPTNGTPAHAPGGS